MTPDPITIPQLDLATSVDFENDFMIIRQGLNDKRIKPGLLNQFKLEDFPTLNSQLVASDVIVVGRNNLGTYTNYITDPRRLGFLVGVTMWFYTDAANVPLYWTNVPALGDRVLAVKGTSGSYTNTGLQGSWQQADWTLTIDQIPSHTHKYKVYKSDIDDNLSFKIGSSNRNSNNTTQTEATGGGQPHNHGALWRPAAAVGLVCQKTG